MSPGSVLGPSVHPIFVAAKCLSWWWTAGTVFGVSQMMVFWCWWSVSLFRPLWYFVACICSPDQGVLFSDVGVSCWMSPSVFRAPSVFGGQVLNWSSCRCVIDVMSLDCVCCTRLIWTRIADCSANYHLLLPQFDNGWAADPTHSLEFEVCPEWPHRQGGCLACCGCTFESRWGFTDLYCARGAQGVLPMRVGVRSVNWIYRLWRHCP